MGEIRSRAKNWPIVSGRINRTIVDTVNNRSVSFKFHWVRVFNPQECHVKHNTSHNCEFAGPLIGQESMGFRFKPAV